MIRLLALSFIIILLTSLPAGAEAGLQEICPPVGIQERAREFQPGGIILTTFDRSALWVYNIDSARRYPLPETAPCTTHCRLSPDARWITYFNDLTNAFNRMRLDGTQRSLVIENAADVEWWSSNAFLVWTPGHGAYLLPFDGAERQRLDVNGVISVQPGGRWGVVVTQDGDRFTRSLVYLDMRVNAGVDPQALELGEDRAYFNAQAWSPDGRWLAYVAPVAVDGETIGAEIFGIAPGDPAPTQWTDLTADYGAARVNGIATGELSWSPDGTRLAFWVTELLGADPTANTGNAVIHVLDVASRKVTAYCGYSTVEHTPNPPRLVWSPDGTHIAFGGNVPEDDKGYLLLALDTATGIFTSLSDGIYPALGSADVVAWGLPPG